jgi:nucleotide-binding universal stress UspA family protein
MFNRILVPTDFSPPSDAAFEYARTLAVKFGSSLQLLHVIDEPNASSAFVADGFAPNTEDIREGMLMEARERLAQVMKVAQRAHIHVTADAIIGMPESAIVSYAAATGTSLVVMGTHGRTGLAHLLMGSVAEHVVRTAPCPVLSVRQVTATEHVIAIATGYCVPIPA